jgi:hypothetical protein
MHYREVVVANELLEVPSIKMPPVDVVVELMLGFCMLLATELTRTSLRPTTEKNSILAPAYRTRDFDIYTTRAAVVMHGKHL